MSNIVPGLLGLESTKTTLRSGGSLDLQRAMQKGWPPTGCCTRAGAVEMGAGID